MIDPVEPRQDGIASFGQRVAALLIDAALLSFVLASVFKISGVSRLDKELASIGGMQFILHWLYFAGMESSEYQATLGKMAFGMKVRDLRNHRLTFAKATGRYFGRILSTLLFGAGFIMAALDSKCRTLHDKLSGTLVFQDQGE